MLVGHDRFFVSSQRANLPRDHRLKYRQCSDGGNSHILKGVTKVVRS